MIFYLLLFLLTTSNEQSQNLAQIEFATGAGYAFGGGAGAFELNFDAVSDTLATGFSFPFYIYVSDERFHFQNKLWDEPSDYAHMIRYLSWKNENSEFKIGFNLGEEVELTLGKGLAVNKLNFMTMFFHPKTGFSAYAEGENIKVSGFIDNFIEPEIIGFDSFYSFNNRITVGISGLSDFSTPREIQSENGSIDYDPDTDILKPAVTEKYFYGAVCISANPFKWLSLGVEGGSLNVFKTSNYGGLAFIELKHDFKLFKMNVNANFGGGSRNFIPYFADPFYLQRRLSADLNSSEPLFSFIENRNVSATSFGVNFDLSSDGFNIRGAWMSNALGNIFQVTSEIMISNKFVLAFYGALYEYSRFLLASQLRFALTENLFLWFKAKHLYSFANSELSSEDAFVGGLGIRLGL